MYIFISAQENYDWNVYRSLQTPALGESHEKELSDERARDRKRTLSRLSVVTGGMRRASLRNTSVFRQMCRLTGTTLFVCLFGNMRASSGQSFVCFVCLWGKYYNNLSAESFNPKKVIVYVSILFRRV